MPPTGSAAADLSEEQRLPALDCPWCGCPCAWETTPGGLAGRCPRHGLVEVNDRASIVELQTADRTRRRSRKGR